MAVSKINTNSLGLTIASGSGTQNPTANNTVYDLVTGLTTVSYTHLTLPTKRIV